MTIWQWIETFILFTYSLRKTNQDRFCWVGLYIIKMSLSIVWANEAIKCEKQNTVKLYITFYSELAATTEIGT